MNIQNKNVRGYLSMAEEVIVMRGLLGETLTNTLWIKCTVNYEIVQGVNSD